VSQDIAATGHEYLPVGGYTGQVPSTPLAQFVAYVRAGRVHDTIVAVRPLTRNPDMRWVIAHCRPVATIANPTNNTNTTNTTHTVGRNYRSYVCNPADARN
jgi:hypothetical protein